MEWSKLKNIIILILVLANLFLLLMVGAQQRNSVQYQEQAISDALTVLDRSGIHLNRDIVPNEISLTPLTVARDRESEAALAAELLGNCTVSDLGGGRFLYESDLGQVEFRNNGNFSFVFSVGAHTASAADGQQAHALATMTRIGFSGIPTSYEEPGQRILISLRQTYQEFPVFSCHVTLEYEGDDLRSITGQRLMGTPVADSDGSTAITVPTALLRILNGITGLGDICSEITDITPGYLLSSTDTVRLVPVWHVTTDTGAYTLNTLTGALDRA